MESYGLFAYRQYFLAVLIVGNLINRRMIYSGALKNVAHGVQVCGKSKMK
jgi:hypothetical protein